MRIIFSCTPTVVPLGDSLVKVGTLQIPLDIEVTRAG